MTSYLYPSKSAGKKRYPVPDALTEKVVIEILHDHSVLPQILWPHSSTPVREKGSTTPGTSEFTIRSMGTNYKATLWSQPTGVTCVEELSLGIKFTVTYAIIGRDRLTEEPSGNNNKSDKASTSSLINSTASLLDHKLYLVEERTMTALRPTMLMLQLKEDEVIMKTKNLLQVLDNLGGSQMDLLSAIADLKSMAAFGGANTRSKKAKNE